jgi:hypothetical protein
MKQLSVMVILLFVKTVNETIKQENEVKIVDTNVKSVEDTEADTVSKPQLTNTIIQ